MRTRHRQQGNFVIGGIIGLLVGLAVALGVAVYVTKVPIPFVSKPQTGSADQDEAEARRNRDWNPNAPLAGRTREAEAPAAPAPAAPPPAVPDPAVAGADPAGPSTVIAPTRVPPPVTVPAAPPAQAQAPRSGAPGSGPIAVNPIRPGAEGSDPLGDLARARSGGNRATSGDTQVAAVSPSAAATPSADPFVYFVQAGAFRTQDDAHAQRARLSLMGVEARVTEREQAGRTVYRVRVGPFGQKAEADRAKSRLDSNGFESALVRVQR